MRRKILLLVALAAILGFTAFVWGATPGSDEDPVVTKSYVDQEIAKAVGSGGASAAVFAPVEIKAGQSLTGGEGTEIILRSGEATAIGSASNGVSDLTSGQDLASGAIIERNHLLLIPRADGRGILAGTDGWLLIKGTYTLS